MLHRAMNKLKMALPSTPLFRLMNPHKAHLYCVGTAKSGTHSIEAIFRGQLRSAHEAESNKVIDTILDVSAGRIDDEELRHYVLKRDRRLWLDVDSSQLNFFLLDKLVELFSDAKFILTIRNPYAWLDSFINHQLAYKSSDKWIQLRDLRFRPDIYTHSQGELALKEKGLYTLDGYFSYWAHHNRTVIETVPEDRLLIVRTDKISECIEEIAAFAGVSKSNLNQEQSHTFKARAKFHLLDKVDQEYLEYKAKEHCGDLSDRFFPEIQSKKDALSSACNVIKGDGSLY
ncbi:MAG: hypothetical protein A2043_06700 [Candidatus Schekmanbacteria bacterium GWA2_38_9]|uniref:Sulfotransferase domain-containing protein n=1 Tax=Candidatus Schekmanbacteria bacterium RIFCSPLOWO2_12_FULL_38_15 TaxID=1817883 RepID=A0A1F7SCJ2_9BACT|nr:MAG: hypothetical protein A2043_06700 [Candidatus Schekmanbacteria bacterium GWA2_38_9]OGL49433.1 MAG: hypothetical protein A3H37_10005 [Candidatus Schekmanbacteria bacterium RIFCSPLOWO2_02_FULL_38_14]OGL51503.1 MAG: hypothetical protein A3G31_03350 [Candidatus Schekmanbacteria bacterium RIFCSPLOWO2_12_FULL_38_15]